MAEAVKKTTPEGRANPKPQRRRTTARGFEAGRQGRRLAAIPSNSLAINSQIRAYGRTLVARSRWLAVNNAYASAAKESFVSALVGNGIKPSSLYKDATIKAAIGEAWLEWTDEADADGLTDFYGIQTVIASEMFEAGECFIRMRDRLPEDNLSVPLQMQILPAEMLDANHNEVLANGGRIECGIEFSPIGKRVAYWFFRNHPGELIQANYALSLKTRVPAEDVLHLFKPIRAGQIRGVPHTLAGLVTLAMVDLYDDAELERKRIAALFAAFVKREKADIDSEEQPFAGAEETPHNNDPASALSDFSLEPGAVIDLPEGQSVEFSEPADVGGNYEPFQYRQLLRAAAGFGTPYSDMTGDLRQTSYGSIRAGLVAFRRRIEAMQNQVMIFQFCRPVFQRWIVEAIVAGAIEGLTASAYTKDPRGVRKVKWIPPKWEWIDPLKDRQAEKLAVDSGFKSRGDVIEAEGYDPEEVDARIKADQDRAAKLGITFIKLTSSVIVSPDDDSFVEMNPNTPDNGENDDFG